MNYFFDQIMSKSPALIKQVKELFFDDWRTKRFNENKEIITYFKDSNQDFYQDLNTEVQNVNAFFILTGIHTNSTSIPLFIKFKKDLGENFTWPDVTTVNRKGYIKFTENKIILNIGSRTKKVINYTFFGFLILFFLLAIILLLNTWLHLFRVAISGDLLCGMIFTSLFLLLILPDMRTLLLVEKMEESLKNNKHKANAEKFGDKK